MLVEVESAVSFVHALLVANADARGPHALPPPHQLVAFRARLIHALMADYALHWWPLEPRRGQAYRCLRINHKLDPLVARAAQQAGLNADHVALLLPDELTLWIDPEDVSYRIGENGSICPIPLGHSPASHLALASPDRAVSPAPASSLASSQLSSLSSSPSSFCSSADLSGHALTSQAFYLNSLLS